MKNKSMFKIAVVLTIICIAMVGTASAKSLYVATSHTTKAFDAYNIAADGTISWQATHNLVTSLYPGGVAIDDVAKALFITSEGSNKIEIVDATTMTSPGYTTVTGATNLAGIDVDDTTHIVYTNQRGTNTIHAYQYNPTAKTLTLIAGFPKTLTTGMDSAGIALDDLNGVLYMSDTFYNKIRGFDINTWTEVFTNTPSQRPVGIAVDRQRGYIYTSALDGWCGGSSMYSPLKRLVKTSISTGTETYVTMLNGGSGIAVDEITGYVYVTEGCNGNDLSVWNTATSPFTSIEVEDLGLGASPAGLAIPQHDISWNPLTFAKTDDKTQANPGNTLTYTLSYTNTNPNPVTNVLITDTLPAGVTYQSDTCGGTLSSGVVTCSVIPSIASGASGSVQVTVTVDSGTLGTITNYADIVSTQTNIVTKYDQTNIVSGTNGEIPEFPTIALPIAAILGLMFLFQRRKD